MLIVFFNSISNAQSFGIGTDSPDPDAILEVYSTSKGVLIPRLTTAQRNANLGSLTISQRGLLIYNVNEAGFNYWNGVAWETFANVSEDVDWFEEGSTNPPNDINDDIFHLGNVAIGKNSADYPLDIRSFGTDRAMNTQLLGNSATSETYGHYVDNSSDGFNTHYGTYNSMDNLNHNLQVGSGQALIASSNGNSVGSLNTITGGSTGYHIGVENDIVGNAADYFIGMKTKIAGSGVGDRFGVVNELSGSYWGEITGVYNEITPLTTELCIGVNNIFEGNSISPIVGTQNTILNYGNGEHVGTNNSIENNGSGVKIGTKNRIYSSGSGSHYGSFNTIESSSNFSSTNSYGIYSKVFDNLAGNHYALYAEALKSGPNTWAGYFLGDVYIGTNATNGYELPTNNGNLNQILQTDGSGQTAWVNPPTFTEDADFYEEGSTNPPNDINDDIYHTGNVAIGKNTATYQLDVEELNGTRAINTSIGGTSNSVIYGHKIVNNNTGTGTHYGTHTSILGSGTGFKYGSFMTFESTLPGTITGNYVNMNATSTSNKYGFRALFNSSTQGNNYGVYVDMSTGSSGSRYGVYSRVSGTNHYAAYFLGQTYISYRLGIGTNAPAYRLHLSANSAAKPTSSAWTVTSDKRLKKDIKPFKDGLELINKINPVWFTYNGKAHMPEETGVGTIAQELKQIAPYMVSDWEHTDTITGEKNEYLAVDYGAMDFVLVNAIKEQNVMIEKLQKQVQILQANLNAIQGKLEEE